MKRLLCLFVLISHSLVASESLYHGTCTIMHEINLEKNLQDFYPELVKALNEKGYSLAPLTNEKGIIPGILYMDFKKIWSGDKLYQDCETTILVKQTKENFRANGDKVIFQESKKRGFPRFKLKDPLRCTSALKDTLFLMPICIKP